MFGAKLQDLVARGLLVVVEHGFGGPLLGYGQNIQSSWNINAAEFIIFIP